MYHHLGDIVFDISLFMFTHGYQVFKSEARKYFICLAASVIVSLNPLFNNLSYTHLKQSQSVLMKVSDRVVVYFQNDKYNTESEFALSRPEARKIFITF